MADPNNDDDDDDMAELFSFGSSDAGADDDAAPPAAVAAASDGTAAGAINRTSSTASTVATDNRTTRSGSDDSFSKLLQDEGHSILGGGTCTTKKSVGFQSTTADAASHDKETQDILDWLDEDDTAAIPSPATHTPLTTDTSVAVESKAEEKETTSAAAAPAPPAPVVFSETVVAHLPPAFATLKEALMASSDSTAEQVRSLAQHEFNNDGKSMTKKLISKELRPEFYCKLVCGKTLQETLQSSLADSFSTWQSQNHATNNNEKQDDIDWIQRASTDLSNSIAEATGRSSSKEECSKDLKDLLTFHVMGQATEEAKKETNWLLPPVAATLLSANIPVVAASVVLQQIIPTLTPLLALQPSESWEAAQSLHSHLYLLAAYHLPLLVFHLDRYLPGWYWPKLPKSTTTAATNNDENDDSDGGGVTQRARHLDQRGQLPPSWLLSLQAGEWQGTQLPVADCVLPLWDVQLSMDVTQSHAARFFLLLAILERAADRLIVLTGEELCQEIQKVFTNIADGNVDDNWLEQWWPAAQQLQLATPESVVTTLNQAEDAAVQDALQRRQERAEAELQARLEAEARAHQALQEQKAEEARERLTRARLVAFYRKHAPDKEGNIDKIMDNYKGRFEVLDAKLIKKYGESFNPAIKPKEKKPNATNKLLATMNQNLGALRKGDGEKEAGDEKKEDDQHKMGDNVSVTVSADEVLPVVCWSKEAAAARGESRRNRPKDDSSGAAARVPLKFFLVDCRSQEAVEEQGQFPTAIQLSPEAMLDPERIQQNEEMFESLRGAVHVVIMGEGFSAIPRLYGQKLSTKLEAAMEQDESRTNICALFFVKKGFPFVSVLNGGFCAAHSWLVREGASRHLNTSSVLIDYDPDNSLFGQMERLHNASATEKAQRKMQFMLEKSLVAVTLRAQQLEKMASEMDKNKQGGGLGNLRSLGQMFGGGGGGAKAENITSSNNQDAQPATKAEDANGDGPASNNSNVKGFKNPFAARSASRSSSDDGSPMDDTTTTAAAAPKVPQFVNPFARKQAGASMENNLVLDAAAGDAGAAMAVSTDEFGTEKNSTRTSAPSAAASNPFAMFRQGKAKDEFSATTAATAEIKPAGSQTMPTFRGLGAALGKAAAVASSTTSTNAEGDGGATTTSTATNSMLQRNPFRFGGGGAAAGANSSKKSEADSTARNSSFAGFNSLRKNTFARMRSGASASGNKVADESSSSAADEEIAFD